MENVLVVWIDQTNYSIALSQNLMQSKALTDSNSVKAEGGEEAAEEKWKLADVDSWSLRKDTISIT